MKEGNWETWGMIKWVDYDKKDVVKLFQEGEEKEAIDYLISVGRIDKDKKDYWYHSTELINYQSWLFIKWANDVKELLK